MDNLGILGYQERSFDEIRSDIVEDLKQIRPQLESLPNSLLDNMIDTGAVLLKQNEGLAKTLFNSISLNSSDPFFDIIAQDYGLARNTEAKAQITMKIKSNILGYMLPVNTIFTNADSSVKFYNTAPLIINSLGECTFTAYSDNLESELKDISVGDINKLAIQDDKITEIQNIDLPNPPISIEEFTEFKERIQQRMRTLISGSRDNLENSIKSIQGVNPLQVKIKDTFISTPISGGVEKYKALECIVGGGDSVEIAYILSQFMGLSPLFLTSKPSNNENERTIKTTIQEGYNSIEVVFTRPKLSKLEITFKPKLYNVITNNQSLELAFADSLSEIFSNLNINQKINKTFLEKTFIDILLEKFNYKPENIVSIDFEIEIDGEAGSFDDNGFISEQFEDTYFLLNNFSIITQ